MGHGSHFETYASRWCSGILDSILLISEGPKPVDVRLCFGLLMPGPTGPARVLIGAPIEGVRSRGRLSTSAEAMAVKRKFQSIKGSEP